MNGTVIDIIRDTIGSRYHLLRNDRDWIVQNEARVEIRSPHKHSMAFCLKHAKEEKGLAFFSASPPKHLAKMCDALIAVSHANTLYLFAIEVKTAHKDDYKKQLANGKYFWDWLIALFREHGYLNETVQHIGLLIWWPREKSVRKGTTTHAGSRLKKVTSKSLFDLKFEARNIGRIQLLEMLEWRRKNPGHLSP
ncbi:MAG: hypothetical protein GKR94_15620 [Gammaproteobacteria bacterium]|nr:hypothetical protein [Gammaproteobacteria bacterium]